MKLFLALMTTFLVQSAAEASNFTPSVLGSEEEAQELLWQTRKINKFQFNVQCYNAAHVRSYEAFERSGLKTMKIFIFFTDSYKRKTGFDWWFHVTPMTYVNVDGSAEARVLDREWSKTPLTIQEWTDKFVSTKAVCPVITKFSDYSEHQEENDCYVMPVSMYYWEPTSLEALEKGTPEKVEFDMDEVNEAYRKDFRFARRG